MSFLFKNKSSEEPQAGESADNGQDLLKKLRNCLNAYISDIKQARKGLHDFIEGAKVFGSHSLQFAQSFQNLDGSLLSLGAVLSKELVTEDVKLNTFLNGTTSFMQRTLSYKDSSVSLTQSAINSIDSKLKLFTKLDEKCLKFDTLCLNRVKLQKRITELQKKGDFDSVSKFSKELSKLNEQHKEEENDLIAKLEYIMFICNKDSQNSTEENVLNIESEKNVIGKGLSLIELELKAFKQSQNNFLVRCLKSLNSSMLNSNLTSNSSNKAFQLESKENFDNYFLDINLLNLDDECIKFHMRLEDKVVQRKRQIQNLNNLQKYSSVISVSSKYSNVSNNSKTSTEAEQTVNNLMAKPDQKTKNRKKIVKPNILSNSLRFSFSKKQSKELKESQNISVSDNLLATENISSLSNLNRKTSLTSLVQESLGLSTEIPRAEEFGDDKTVEEYLAAKKLSKIIKTEQNSESCEESKEYETETTDSSSLSQNAGRLEKVQNLDVEEEDREEKKLLLRFMSLKNKELTR